MINVDTDIGRSMYDGQLYGKVTISVPNKLKPIAKKVLTHELSGILKALDGIDPDIITGAMEILIKEVQNEQN